MSILDQLRSLAIERTVIDTQITSTFNSEHDFNGLVVDLGVEFGQWVCAVGSFLPGDTRVWTKNQAVLGGQLVRLYKLISAMLDQTVQGRSETLTIFGRLAFECIVNIRYLISKDSDDIFIAFIADSFRHEKKLLKYISTNVSDRGSQLPIETRMITSINRTFQHSGIDMDTITHDSTRAWRDVNLYQRASAVELGDAYLGLFGGPSASVHGNWQDLLQHHLKYDENKNGYTPVFKWHAPRPQHLLAVIQTGVTMLADYIQYIYGSAADEVIPLFVDLEKRTILLDRAHEGYLIQKMKQQNND